MTGPRDFYDQLADAYHLIFDDWDRSIARQGAALSDISRRWRSVTGIILDAAAGIGTQTLALGAYGFKVVSSDISTRALSRARAESENRNIAGHFAAADFRALPFKTGFADVAIACDNALPHLKTHADIAMAIQELARCVRTGGGVMISMRDYDPQPTGTNQFVPYGEREWRGRRYVAEQEWEWHGRSYVLSLRIRPLDNRSDPLMNLQTTYFAVSINEVLDLMHSAGLADVERIDNVFFQPLLVGTVSSAA